MKRIKGVYFGYELIDGSKYSLVNVGCHYYKVLKMKKRGMVRNRIKIYKLI